jgi:hypothetical protein
VVASEVPLTPLDLPTEVSSSHPRTRVSSFEQLPLSLNEKGSGP